MRLRLRRFVPRGSGRGVALVTHAMMANGSYQAAFASHLATRGVEAWVLDFRGHGASVPPSPRRGPDWGFDDYVEHDLPAAIGQVCRGAGVDAAALAYVGHSLGGLAGLAAFGTGVAPPPRRLALVTTSVWMPGKHGTLAERAGGLAFRALANAFGYLPVRLARLGTDDEPWGYAHDFARWAREGSWCSRWGRDYTAGLGAIRPPTLVVLGERDRLCSEKDARALSDRLGAEARIAWAPGDHFGFFTQRERATTLWDDAAGFLGAP